MISSLPKPEVIITHESDLDGLVSGVLLQRLARKLFAADVRLEAYNHHNWRQRELREKSAWVADLAYEPRLDRPNWVIIDHHATALAPRNAVFIHSLNKSAALLCYELCRQQGLGSPELDRLVHLTNVGDLFLEDDPDFVLASDYASLVKHYQFWNLHALVNGQIEQLLNNPLLRVMEVKRNIEDPLGFAWARENINEISPQVGFVDTIIGNTNLIVHQLLEQGATKYPVLLTLFRRANGVIIASLRSRNGQAVKVVEKLQGGGHANASAATLPRSVKTIPDAITYLRQVLNPQKETPVNSLEEAFAAFDQSQKSGA
ncbi:MAG TPA: DHH family phosphoesterase [Verrucomicrobiota bacterium]|jgi:oligoribonuclease NrnB/cAMP/cGMP phosphodiesterase (DHH superfamily)|nr:DHH family phosphoesterase [Verrucomicrobiota bacterium]OQC26254.1 MAG: DHHA1 domain protein [Verrucomicrobia bacterium ADurb.Bin063]HRR65076.1 DHH family phosphoesterase [Candidatus Paceibacterota bacterium]HNR71961.1 DHH family phosphoesterase [Verrucomicrobiota bacterium]HNW07463.1 DHH family phosphoesterase [Verrucomicrobiota bacterium]